MRNRQMHAAVLMLGLVGLVPIAAQAQTVYLGPEEALKLIYPTATITRDEKTLTVDEEKSLAQEHKIKLGQLTWKFQVAHVQETIVGYALIDNEIGKTEPITFLTAITPGGEVQAVEILVYRESYGSEVHGRPFLKQFANKKVADPLKLGRDIANITGATFSARAVTRGVKRALTLWNFFYGKK